MNRSTRLAGIGRHILLTLRLNFRSKQALAYGYLMPVIFLLAFAALFRGSTPVLQDQLGQLLTITILGSCALGLPTALVAERELGLWRCYRLLPVPTGLLLVGVLVTRVILVAGAVLLQLALARLLFGTPLPAHPLQFTVAFLFVTFAFLGLGLVITALAENVPAVQALGQCLFLPMIMIGGVGVPLAALPAWAQQLAGFMPGRYAVELLQAACAGPAGPPLASFPLAALFVIGLAATVVGVRAFRWDAGRAPGRWRWFVIAPALLAWIGVGVVAEWSGRLQPVRSAAEAFEAITDDDLQRISFADLPGDNELVTRLAPPFSTTPPSPAGQEFIHQLAVWSPGAVADPVQRFRHLLSVAAVADVSADLKEAEIARAVYNELTARTKHAQARRLLAWISLHPNDGTVLTTAPELGLAKRIPEPMVRERSQLYARKFLGRLTGRLTD